MKKFLLLTILSSLLLGCSPELYRELAGIADYRPYTKEGFILSPVSEGYKYSPIGTISLEFHIGYIPKDKVKAKTSNLDDVLYPNDLFSAKYSLFQPNIDHCLAKIVEYAKSLGATGILDLKILNHYTYSTNGSKNLDYIEATGFAVVIEK